MPAATLDLQLTGKSTHPIKGSPRLLLSIANNRLSQGKPPWVTRGARGSRGERCREESWLQEQRIYLLYKNYLAEGRSRSACLGKTRQRSFAPGGNSPYCVESGGSVGNRSHELTPSLASSPKAVLVSKNAPAWSSAALQEGTQQWLRVSALGVKAPALLWPQHYPPHAPCSDFEILKPLWGEKMTFLDRLCLLWAWRAECWEEQTGSEGLISECWGCGDTPSPPTTTPHTYACKATASAELMRFAAPPRSCLSCRPAQQSQKAAGASRFRGLRTGGAVSARRQQMLRHLLLLKTPGSKGPGLGCGRNMGVNK